MDGVETELLGSVLAVVYCRGGLDWLRWEGRREFLFW
jgi:hypothetical protein